jgi:hypothetical protein
MFLGRARTRRSTTSSLRDDVSGEFSVVIIILLGGETFRRMAGPITDSTFEFLRVIAIP